MTDLLSSDDWGTREQAIPGEWAMLVLIIVAGGALGFLVLWFTMLRHERTVLHRARRRSMHGPDLLDEGGTALLRLEPVAEADDTAEAEAEARADADADADDPAEAQAQAQADAEAAPDGTTGPENDRLTEEILSRVDQTALTWRRRTEAADPASA